MDSTAPEVSVIIVNWHTRDYLIDCIASLLRTTSRTRIEIIVVDNASTDGSQQALREVYPDVTLIQNDDNLGFAKANNRGFKAARGQAVCLVNTDVIAFDGVIDTLWEYLREHPKVGMVGPQTLHRDLKVRENCRRFPSLANTCGDYLWLKRLGIPRPRRTCAPTAHIQQNASGRRALGLLPHGQLPSLGGSRWLGRRLLLLRGGHGLGKAL